MSIPEYRVSFTHDYDEFVDDDCQKDTWNYFLNRCCNCFGSFGDGELEYHGDECGTIVKCACGVFGPVCNGKTKEEASQKALLMWRLVSFHIVGSLSGGSDEA